MKTASFGICLDVGMSTHSLPSRLFCTFRLASIRRYVVYSHKRILDSGITKAPFDKNKKYIFNSRSTLNAVFGIPYLSEALALWTNGVGPAITATNPSIHSSTVTFGVGLPFTDFDEDIPPVSSVWREFN